MAKAGEKKKEIMELLKEIQARLDVYQSRKDDFEMFSLEEKAHKVRNRGEYEGILRSLKNELREYQAKQNEASDEVSRIKVAIKNFQIELQQVNSDLSVNQKQIYEHHEGMSLDQDFKMSVNLTQQQKNIKVQMREVRNRKEKLKNQL